jgi:serine/threonine protein kinase
VNKLSAGSHLAGKYHILSILETRSFCVKYHARDSVLQKQWVIKQFEIPSDDDKKKEFLDHFYAEGEREGAITIEQLPRVEEFFAEKGCAWTVSEHIPGRSVQDVVEANGGPLDEEMVRGWMESMGRAIQFLHGQEPRMVLGGFDREEFVVTDSGALRLREYGMARIYPPARRVDIPPDGLPRWYDSELLRNAKATRQADIWSLGALAYYCLTAKDADHEGRAGLKQLRPAVSEDLAGVIEKCLEPFGENVYHAIEEVLDDLSGRQVRDTSRPPRLGVVPPRLDFKNVTPGDVPLERFKIVNEGGGTLAGHVHSTVPWLQVSPQHFEGNEQEMQVWIDTSVLDEDVRARGDVLVTSATEEVRVPVTLELNLGKVGGLSPMAASLIMLLVAALPVGVLAWLNIGAVQSAAQVAAQAGSTPLEKVPDFLALRGTGTALLIARFAVSLLVPLGVFAVWRTLGIGARRRTTLMAMATMLLPALCILIAMRATEGTFAAAPVVERTLHMAPSWGGWWCIVGTLVASIMLLTPGTRYPLFFRYSAGLRVLLAAVLFLLYAYQMWAHAAA